MGKLDASPIAPTEGSSMRTGTTVAGWIACASGYYAFFIYAQAAALVFPNVFFPSGNPAIAVVASLATFGVGYAARPIGGLVLGSLGDRRGRRTAVFTCMLLMGTSTFLIALLPTYSSLGTAATVGLVCLRLIQGFTIGGLLPCASVLMVEHAEPGRRGYRAGFAVQGVQAGQLIAAAVFLPLSAAMSAETFQAWGWRIPFLLTAVIVPAAYLLRRRIQEPPAFQFELARADVHRVPILRAIRESPADMARVGCMALMNAIPTAVTVFGATYATNRSYGVGMSTTTYLWISVCGNTLAVVLIPQFAKLSDRIGRKPCIIASAIASGILAFGFLAAVGEGSVPAAFVLAMLMWGVAYQGFNAVFPAFYSELFPARFRASAFAGSINMGVMVTAILPSIMTVAAPPGANVPIIVGYLTVGCAAVAAIATISARETHRISLTPQYGVAMTQSLTRDSQSRPPAASPSMPGSTPNLPSRQQPPIATPITTSLNRPTPASGFPSTSETAHSAVQPTSVPRQGFESGVTNPSRGNGIFISYRRRDEPNFTGRLYDRLVVRFGTGRVFMDIDSIELGVDFSEVIESSLRRCAVMLVIIGRDWLDSADEPGRRRLANPGDYVRLEIESGLSSPGIRVIPILVEGATIPAETELPSSLAALSRRNGIDMSHMRFSADVDRLFKALERAIERT